ncbi:TetR family transcriptional regulator [Yinghuangia soli]|uniref:TetR family transcriptional regulator n=1 Tax=Yinghuangia soli TaxID=2908204 RepID=A0AA41Q817_9ACTN|nr:TetR family transcriptional regulator [Yinghuangia soli]MCF2533329.1 TetR family transcriptional regulator [Yinghuangia soli]
MPTHELPPRAVDTMTRSQLARHRRVTDAVIDLIGEMDPASLQMRDVAERSGVSLATIYRYFSSKDHLLAAAVADWQARLTERVLGEMSLGRTRLPAEATAEERVLRFAQRELRAFQRQPNFGHLAVSLIASSDPYASETIARMQTSSRQAMHALMADLPPETAETIQIAVQGVVLSSLIAWMTGRKAWPEILADVERVTRLVFSALR